MPALPWTQVSPSQLPRTGPSQKGKLCCTVEALTGEWHKLWRHSPKQDADSVRWGLVHGESKNQLEPSQAARVLGLCVQQPPRTPAQAFHEHWDPTPSGTAGEGKMRV